LGAEGGCVLGARGGLGVSQVRRARDGRMGNESSRRGGRRGARGGDGKDSAKDEGKGALLDLARWALGVSVGEWWCVRECARGG
jgi:hypothetical protein